MLASRKQQCGHLFNSLVVALGWNFSERLLQCLLCETINSPMISGTWIHENSIHKWIHYRNPSCDFSNSLIRIHKAYFTSEFNIYECTHFHFWIKYMWLQSLYIRIRIMNPYTYEFIYKFRIYLYEFIYSWIYIIISYMNSCKLWIRMIISYMDSYIWVHIMNSCNLWIHIWIHNISYIWIHMIHKFIYELGVPRFQMQVIWNLGYDFTIFFMYMNSYMNSWVMKCRIWIHDHEIIYEFIIWIHVWIHGHEEYHEIICQNSYVWIRLCIHAGEFMIMKSYMNS